MSKGKGIVPELPQRNQTAPGATLTADEIAERVRKGDIKLGDMTIRERERYRHLAPKYKGPAHF